MKTNFLIMYQCVKRRKTKVKQYIGDTAVLQETKKVFKTLLITGLTF